MPRDTGKVRNNMAKEYKLSPERLKELQDEMISRFE